MTEKALCLVVVDGNLPDPDEIVLLTQRFRGAVLKEAMKLVCKDLEDPRWEDLAEDQLAQLQELTGKDSAGRPLTGRQHLAFLPWYGPSGEAERLYLWKPSGLSEIEVQAILSAARRSVVVGCTSIHLAPFGRLALPENWLGPFATWESTTPFVAMSGRHRFRPNGKERATETPQRQLEFLLEREGMKAKVVSCECTGPSRIHRSLQHRNMEIKNPPYWPGHRVRIEFEEPQPGPFFWGHSNHFGLGLFQGVAS